MVNKSKKNFHLLQPDYSNKVFELPDQERENLFRKFTLLYGMDYAEKYFPELERIIKVYYAHKTDEMIEWEKTFKQNDRFTEKDTILITYGDLILEENEQPLKTLSNITHTYFKKVFNTIHILPFFPYSSDRGFAVMDFEEVDPRLGTWENIIALKDDFNLMFDGVFNHVSSKSRWFQEFLNQNPYYSKFFTMFSTKEKISADHLKLIVRPRTSNVLTEFNTLNGVRLVWTTFSPDQIDLNFKNPRVLIKMVEILLTYVRRGADIIRLDAVTYLWEELGTSCAHLDQTHITIQFFRYVLNIVAPHVALITETNVPHEDNIRYFGDGSNEAQMVYNFALPPLVLHTFQTENASKLSDWASALQNFSDSATYFNFLDSHDGVGLMAVKNILSREEIEWMALRTVEHGGYISYKDNGDGTFSPYELNITWFSAINREDDTESNEKKVQRYIASRSIAFVIKGIPGIYLHGMLGSKNDAEAVINEKDRRSINRKTLNKYDLLDRLEDKTSTTYQVTKGLIHLLKIRTYEKSFHPNADQHILQAGHRFFCVLRMMTDNQKILTIVNITNKVQVFRLTKTELIKNVNWIDLIHKQKYSFPEDYFEMRMQPYEIRWLKAM